MPDWESALEGVWAQVLSTAPAVLTGLAVLLGLWLLAIVLRAITRRLLGITKLDDAVGKTRVGKIIGALGEDMTASRAIAQLVYLAIVVLALTTAADVAGLDAVQEILSSVLGYIPQLLSAVLIVAAGGYVATLVSDAIGKVLKEMRSPYAKLLAGISEGALLVLAITIAIDTLGVDLTFVTSNITLVLGAVTVTLCFLFAWSMRRPAEDIIANYYLRRMVRIGDRIELGDVEGVVERFAAIGVLLRQDSQELRFVPARHVLEGLRHAGSAKKKS